MSPARGQATGESDILDFDAEERDTTAADADSLGAEDLEVDEEGEGLADRRRARADTTLASGILTPFQPSYNTTYDVARQTTNWNQEFKFGAKAGILSFNNTTKFNVRKDSSLDQVRRDGSNVTSLRFRNIPLNATLDLRRASEDRPGNERQNDDIRLGVSSRDLKKELLSVTNRISFGGAYSYRSDEALTRVNRRRTFDSGLEGNLSWRGSWDPWRFLNMDGDAKLARTGKSSRLEITQPDKPDSTEQTPTENINRSLGFKVRIEPSGWWTADLGVSASFTDDESFSAVLAPNQPANKPELRTGQRRSFTGRMELFRHLKDTRFTFDVGAGDQELTYRYRTNFSYLGESFNWKGDFKTKFVGTDVNVTLSRSQDFVERYRQEVVETVPGEKDTILVPIPTDTHNNVFDGKLARRFSGKFQARFNWLVRANQLFSDGSSDRDELRVRFQPMVSYNPNRKWTVNASYIGSNVRRSEINPTQALQSRNEDDFTVDVGISYSLSDVTRISQIYSIKAIYTTFDYNPRSDRLLKTQRITTSLETQVGPRFDFRFEHRFTLQDSGPFRFDESGVRIFERDVRKYRQELEANVKYQLTSWASALINSQFFRNDDVNEFLDRRSVSRNLLLRTGLDFRKDLRGATQVWASGQYVQSNVQDAYWSFTSGLSKDF